MSLSCEQKVRNHSILRWSRTAIHIGVKPRFIADYGGKPRANSILEQRCQRISERQCWHLFTSRIASPHRSELGPPSPSVFPRSPSTHLCSRSDGHQQRSHRLAANAQSAHTKYWREAVVGRTQFRFYMKTRILILISNLFLYFLRFHSNHPS